MKRHDPDGRLAHAFRDVMVVMEKQKAEGVPFEQRVKGLEGVIRDCWPVVREWKYLCQQCEDYGLIISACPGDSTCGRHNPHLPHDYGTPCQCEKGRRYRPPAPPEPEDFSEVGTSKRRSRKVAPLGRWGG